MPPLDATGLVHHFRAVTACSATSELTDCELLQRFALAGDETAFAALLRRHGSMVRRVCRHVLRQEQDAEDALQATFLVLARKAGSIRNQQTLAGWLYGVAYRSALTARKMLARQRRRDGLAEKPASQQPFAEASLRELQALLHQEVQRLPEKFRSAFVLCCLEGHSKAEAARELGCKEGTVSSRLVQARAVLQRRLTRRGVSLSAALTALAVGSESSVAMPATWVASTLNSLRAGAEPAVPGTASVRTGAAAIAQGLVRSWALGTLTWIAGMVLAVGIVVAGAGALMQAQPQGSSVLGDPPVRAASARQQTRGPSQAHTDAYGDPLPPGTIARLGTVRLRHGGATTLLAYSPDGRVLASAGKGRGLCVWDVGTGKLRHELVPVDSVWDFAFSPDSKLLAAGGYGNRGIQIWEVTTGKELRRLKNSDPAAQRVAVAFSPDGKLLASSGNDKLVTLWDVATGERLRQLPGSQESITAVAFSPDNRFVAAASGKQIQLWNAVTCSPHAILSGHKGMVIRIAFSPDGKQLASGGTDQTIHLWDMAICKEFKVLEAPGTLVMAVAFSPDGQTLASGHCDGTLRLWESASGRKLRQQEACALPVDSLAFAPDGKTLVTGADEHSALRLWDPATGLERRQFAGPLGAVHQLAFAANRRSVLVGSKDHKLRWWNFSHGTEAIVLSWPPGYLEDTLTLTPDGPIAAAYNWLDSTIRVWDPKVQREPCVIAERVRAMSALALSPDGKRLLGATGVRRQAFGTSGDGYRTIYVWNIQSGKEVHKIEGLDDDVHALTYSPDGRVFASGHPGRGRTDGKLAGHGLRLWDATTLEDLRRFDTQEGVDLVAFSPDGRLLASGKKRDSNQPARLWETATGKEYPLPVEVHGCTSLVFSPDNKFLAIGTAIPESAVVLIDISSGNEVRRLQGHHSGIGAVAFSPDGKLLATGGGDSTVLVWDISGHQAFAPDRRSADLGK
jgi:RNA polymerase sigma factor (sigma-70 family)